VLNAGKTFLDVFLGLLLLLQLEKGAHVVNEEQRALLFVEDDLLRFDLYRWAIPCVAGVSLSAKFVKLIVGDINS